MAPGKGSWRVVNHRVDLNAPTGEGDEYQTSDGNWWVSDPINPGTVKSRYFNRGELVGGKFPPLTIRTL